LHHDSGSLDERMLAPRFTIRTLLALVAAGAIIFLIAGMAVRGETWAWSVTIGVLSLAVTAAAHAVWFGVAWMFAQLPASRRLETGQPVAPRRPTAATMPNEPTAGGGQGDRAAIGPSSP
jgi:hypothetical protein